MDFARIHAFVAHTGVDDMPPAVRRQAERCVLDLAGAAIAGRATPVSRIIHDHAVRHFAAGEGAVPVRLLFDGRRASAVGAAMAGGMTIDSFDSHDGHVLTKGHAGAALLPGLFALIDEAPARWTGPAFLAALTIGYEIAIRAGIAQHASVPDYHTSGAWNALGVAAIAGRLRGFDGERLRHALGIAEYHGPRSPMMRCIDFPTMVKDGSGWGAMVGLSAALLAADGFTGAPALVVEDGKVAPVWEDLGVRWRILEMYFKPYPICRWAQPALEAALILRRAHGLAPAMIDAVEVESFHEAIRLDQRRPTTTEEAQYSLPFPLAAALVRGTLAPSDVAGAALSDPTILAMSARVRLIEAADLNARFPAERLARVRLKLVDGRVLESATTPARGDAERPLDDAEILAKFHALADSALGLARTRAIVEEIAGLGRAGSMAPLADLLLSAPQTSAAVAAA